VNFDLSGYDLICFGTPVWAFGPTPAMNTYLADCSGLEGKEIILFATYGSGAGKERCLNYMQNILAQKGAKGFKRFSIQQFKVNDKEFVLEKIKEII
jgi:NAD(P)H-dependent FMN reductase